MHPSSGGASALRAPVRLSRPVAATERRSAYEDGASPATITVSFDMAGT